MLDFTRSGLPNVSQSKSKFTTFSWSDNCSLFTDYANVHLSLNMLQLIVSSYITCNALYAIVLSVLSKYWFRTLVSLFVWLFLICPHTDLVTVPPTESKPIHKLYISARGHYCGKKVPAYFGFMIDITPVIYA